MRTERRKKKLFVNDLQVVSYVYCDTIIYRNYVSYSKYSLKLLIDVIHEKHKNEQKNESNNYL